MTTNANIKNLIDAIETKSVAHSREGRVQYAYVAGYYESMLSQLAHDIPEVAEFIQNRVKQINFNKQVA